MIRIKDHEVLESLLIHAAHPILIALLKWIVVRYSETVFTLGFEDRSYPSVHSTIPFRAADIRSRGYDDSQAVEDDINAHWEYDRMRPRKKCADWKDSGRGYHIHLQVHENTRYLGSLKPTDEMVRGI